MTYLNGIILVTKYIFLLMVMVSCYGCYSGSRDTQRLKKEITTMQQSALLKQEKTIAITILPPEPAVFSTEKRRVPFGEVTALVNNLNQSKYPLLMFPLNVLQFIGTMTKDQMMYAYILAPDNKLYAVKVGDKIGNQENKVILIKENKVELLDNTDSKENSKTIIMELGAKQ